MRRLGRMSAQLHGPLPALSRARACGRATAEPNGVVVPRCRPHSLGNPWPVSPNQTLAESCQLCELLMLHGGSPRSYGGITV